MLFAELSQGKKKTKNEDATKMVYRERLKNEVQTREFSRTLEGSMLEKTMCCNGHFFVRNILCADKVGDEPGFFIISFATMVHCICINIHTNTCSLPHSHTHRHTVGAREMGLAEVW